MRRPSHQLEVRDLKQIVNLQSHGEVPLVIECQRWSVPRLHYRRSVSRRFRRSLYRDRQSDDKIPTVTVFWSFRTRMQVSSHPSCTLQDAFLVDIDLQAWIQPLPRKMGTQADRQRRCKKKEPQAGGRHVVRLLKGRPGSAAPCI